MVLLFFSIVVSNWGVYAPRAFLLALRVAPRSVGVRLRTSPLSIAHPGSLLSVLEVLFSKESLGLTADPDLARDVLS